MRLKRENNDEAAIAWAQACDLRRVIERARYSWKWPANGITGSEERTIAQINGLLEEARDLTMKLQSSMSERSRMAGHENPNYTVARGQLQ